MNGQRICGIHVQWNTTQSFKKKKKGNPVFLFFNDKVDQPGEHYVKPGTERMLYDLT